MSANNVGSGRRRMETMKATVFHGKTLFVSKRGLVRQEKFAFDIGLP
jgi:hypothetical protein